MICTDQILGASDMGGVEGKGVDIADWHRSRFVMRSKPRIELCRISTPQGKTKLRRKELEGSNDDKGREHDVGAE